jgi:hypothetical protein
MLKFEKDGDGYLVTMAATGRAVCRIQTSVMEAITQKQPPDDRIVTFDKVKPLPREQWLFHFCAGRFSEATLAALISEFPKE